jgi:hypothetical protein
MERIVEDCRSAGITPVILSPFVYGSRYSTSNAITYANALRQLQSRAPGMIFVDCISLLSAFPRYKILLHDGFHLSPLGQNLVGEAVGEAIVENVMRREMVDRDGGDRRHQDSGAQSRSAVRARQGSRGKAEGRKRC